VRVVVPEVAVAVVPMVVVTTDAATMLSCTKRVKTTDAATMLQRAGKIARVLINARTSFKNAAPIGFDFVWIVPGLILPRRTSSSMFVALKLRIVVCS
jgi:hypothetical protein